ncbi:MAG: RloB domain-containing protein [Candidatus Pacebacteria bacterium]|nr:RloB domain-containing protein [Candidatus Paceibacterota bacterium]
MNKRGNRNGRVQRERAPLVWVFCEGAARGSGACGTEEWYLSECKSRGVSVKILPCGKSGSALIEQAVTRLAHEKRKPDTVWLVFDKDNLGARFDAALREAETCGFRVAYSIECFEVWLLLHFLVPNESDERDCAYRAQQLEQEIRRVSGNAQYTYDKTENLFQKLYAGRVVDAIRNAQLLEQRYGVEIAQGNRVPYTNVHVLIEDIRKGVVEGESARGSE